MKKLLFATTVFAAIAVQAAVMDRPGGIKIGQRMTIRPYVSFSYTFDSNVDSSNNQGSFSSFSVAPGLSLSYTAENWNIQFGAYYQYHAYSDYAKSLNQSSWGQNFAFSWTNSKDGGRGWSFTVRENLCSISQDDDMMNDGGRGIGRDRMQMGVAASLQRRFTEKLHGNADVSFYGLDYANDQSAYAPLYGWSRWTAGAQLGYAFSRWIDLFITGNYQGYLQDNNSYYGTNPGDISGQSQGYSIHAGIGSYATEKISYSISGGYSQFRYSNGDWTLGGFTYAISAHWRMSDTWNMMLMASSYYQPDETRYGAMTRCDALSWGIAHSMIRNKLTASFDIAYRHNGRSAYLTDWGRTDDVITTRLGLRYAINRFISVYGNCEYQTNFTDGNNDNGDDYSWDYNRWRLTCGLTLTY